MAERWFAVCQKDTGEAVSFATVVTDPLPAHLEAIAVAKQPDEDTEWSKETRRLVAKTPRVPPPTCPTCGKPQEARK